MRSCACYIVSAQHTSINIIWSNVPPKEKLSRKQPWEVGGDPLSELTTPIPSVVTMTTGDSSPGSPVSFR